MPPAISPHGSPHGSRHTGTNAPEPALPVLLVTGDERLIGDVLRLAAAAGVTLDVAHDAGSALRSWSAAAELVLVGLDVVAELAERRPARHDDVHVVVLTGGPPPDAAFRAAVAVGARDVVELPAGEPWLVELLGDAVDGGRGEGEVLGVIPGSGGAGASTFAAGVAQVAARSGPVVLVDLDPWGAGLARTLGFEEVDGIRWDALTSGGRLGSRSLRAALPARSGLSLLTFGADPAPVLDEESVREVVGAARRAGDLVVLDLPRTAAATLPAPDPAGAGLALCDRLLLVVLGTVAGVASAARVAARLAAGRAEVGTVVRTVTGAVPPASAAEALGLPLVAAYPNRRRVVEQVDLGLGPVRSMRAPLARAARDALHRVEPAGP